MYQMPKWTTEQKQDLRKVLTFELASRSFHSNQFFVAKIRVFPEPGGYSVTFGELGEEPMYLRLQRKWSSTPKPTWS